MSAGYASRLSHYPNKGICGLPEMTDSSRSLKLKLDRLANMIKNSNYVVILTGAGISTSAGIPDFRGPKGIWTLENKNDKMVNGKNKKENIKKSDVVKTDGRPPSSISKNTSPCFATARPTLTHVSITKLVSLNIVKFCITQNVDGLHRRSGLPRDKQAILHGCVFTEKCERCNEEYFRNYDVGGVSFQLTGRKCEKCNGKLRDTVLDWDDELPEPDYGFAQDHCMKADLVISLGTSLRIEPAGSLPELAKKYVIVNMQRTPKDNGASLLIRAKVDEVMEGLLDRLGLNDSISDD